jgi:hypothetical protein
MPAEEVPIAVVAVSGVFLALTVVASLIIWQVGATWRARMSVAREAAYQQLATEATQAQSRTANAVELTNVTLNDVRTRLTEIERVLKEVG